MECEKMTEREMWRTFCAEKGIPTDTPYEAWAFCGGGEGADELAALVLSGCKTATSSTVLSFRLENAPLPQAGGYSVILYANGEAACVLRDTEVTVAPFNEGSERHAYREGEGGRTLEEWREIHRRAFAPDYEAAGLAFDEAGLCVLEEFERVYP